MMLTWKQLFQSVLFSEDEQVVDANTTYEAPAYGFLAGDDNKAVDEH